MKLNFQTKEELRQLIDEALENLMDTIEGEDVIDFVDMKLDRLSYQEKKKLVDLVIRSCAEHNAVEILRDSIH